MQVTERQLGYFSWHILTPYREKLKQVIRDGGYYSQSEAEKWLMAHLDKATASRMIGFYQDSTNSYNQDKRREVIFEELKKLGLPMK